MPSLLHGTAPGKTLISQERHVVCSKPTTTITPSYKPFLPSQRQTNKSSAASSNAERDTHSMASTITGSSLQSLQAAHMKSLCRYKNKYGPPVKNTGMYSKHLPPRHPWDWSVTKPRGPVFGENGIY